MEDTDCKCTKGQTVHYAWAGDDISKEDGETWAHAIAGWFAEKAANEELHWENLDSKRFNQFKTRTAAFVEEKMDRLVHGELSPGSEVVYVELAAHKTNKNLPIFELRWHQQERMLKNRKMLVRQYEGEPFENEPIAFGLHMHLKNTRSENHAKINHLQDDEIRVAVHWYELHEQQGDWPEPE